MDNVIRLSKFVKNLGIVTTVLFLIIVLVTFVTGNMGVAICFMPFVFLGIALILAYKKQIIVVNEDEIVFSYLVKKTQHIKYNDIRCILMIPLNGRTDVILINKMYNRLVTLEQVYVNYDILYDTLIKHEIDLVDFGELVEQNKDVSKYVPALNWIEKNFYKSICNENTTIKNMSKTIEKEKRKKTKQFLKALGWILIIADAVAFFIGGKNNVSYIYNGFDDYICSVYKILSIYIYRSHHKKRTRTGVSITIYGCSNSNAFIPEYE